MSTVGSFVAEFITKDKQHKTKLPNIPTDLTRHTECLIHYVVTPQVYSIIISVQPLFKLACDVF